MSKVVWKTQFALPNNMLIVEAPHDAVFLTAREQYGLVCVWFLCDPAKPTIKFKLLLTGTGQTVPDDGRYVGTAVLEGGSLILHVWQVPWSKQ